MPTLSELQDLAHGDDIDRGRIERAITIKALAVTKEATPNSDRLQWAEGALAMPGAAVQLMLNYVLAENAAVTVAQIIAVGDSSIQTNVDDAVDALHP